MEERYNPMKSAEIATEHNYNMLDGVLNNQAPPPEEKELDNPPVILTQCDPKGHLHLKLVIIFVPIHLHHLQTFLSNF